MEKKTKVKKNYKDSVFRLLFGQNREELLTLYNAVNGSHYTNADELTINTLEDAIYVGMRNDVSFVFQDDLNLYEHQSTLNPNLPLRDLFYVADLLQEMTNHQNIYGTKRLSIPTPRFVVFYNGTADMGDAREYRLSDMFVKEEKHPQLELIVKIVNINYGQRNKVLNSCRTLKEYAKFIAMIRENQKTMILKKAVTKAVDDCIARGILKEFLIRQKPRVIEMSILYEYDAEKQREFDREEGKEELLFSLIANALKHGKKYNEIAEFLQVTPDQIKKVEETL